MRKLLILIGAITMVCLTACTVSDVENTVDEALENIETAPIGEYISNAQSVGNNIVSEVAEQLPDEYKDIATSITGVSIPVDEIESGVQSVAGAVQDADIEGVVTSISDKIQEIETKIQVVETNVILTEDGESFVKGILGVD